ncbi:hypothetical protein VXS05_10350 [Photobacterium toruni]|uniref:hypothetical protein n=1 Tax=Photobacterium toruni TaxID=1935446 RepID=UPI002E187516|nr:hypothetical protein [Photobacterium toruni]
MKLSILKGFNDYDEYNYEKACKELGIDYDFVNIIGDNWINEINNSTSDGFLARPPCDFLERKNIYDERLYFINKIMKKNIYPSFDELFIYENKRNMAAWLEINKFPHVKTHVFLLKNEALDFCNKTSYPIITKSNIGASSSGVKVLKNIKDAKKFINSVFGFNSKLAIGAMPKVRKFNLPIPIIGSAQKHTVLFQEFIDIKWEWRIIKIGDSFFGYKKLLGSNGLASGNNLDGWGEPPKELLFMVKDLCDKGGFLSMAVDVFETIDGIYYINELQSIFGAYNNSQMYINNEPCRFIYDKGIKDFFIEKGYFCQNGCANLRVEDFIKKLNNKAHLTLD